jgi:hypothetical protein
VPNDRPKKKVAAPSIPKPEHTPEHSDRLRLIEFAEKRAEDLMKFHLEDMAIINREANATFTFAMAALSFAFGYLVNLYEPRASLSNQRWVWLAPE